MYIIQNKILSTLNKISINHLLFPMHYLMYYFISIFSFHIFLLSFKSICYKN